MLTRINKTDEEGVEIVCNVDENGVEQGPFEMHYSWGNIKGYYKDGKKDGPATLTHENGFVSHHVYRDDQELSGQEADAYLQEWETTQQKNKEKKSQLNFTLLTEDQIFGKKQLDIMRILKYGTKVAETDLSAVLRKGEPTDHVDSWTASPDILGSVSCVSNLGHVGVNFPYLKVGAIRPALSPSETSKITPIAVKKDINGVDVALYGEYPQTVADEAVELELERRFNLNSIEQTGKHYTFDAGKDYNSFQPQAYPEYEYGNQKYIRVKGNVENYLSNGKKIQKGRSYWIRVEPIEWLMDPSGTWVSKKNLISGIQFDNQKKYDGDFEHTFMKHYLDTYFSKEIEPFKSEKEKERKATLEGLKAKLAEASDLDRARADIKPARTPERTELAARMKRSRRERDVIRAAADKACADGDKKLFNEIAELAKVPMARARAVMQKYQQRQAERLAKKDRE